MEKELLVAGMEGRDGGRDSSGVWDAHVHTALFKKDNQQGPTVQHREICSMLCSSLDGRGVQGRMDIFVCVAESFHRSSETITTLLIGYPQYKRKTREKKKKRVKLVSL